MNEVIRSSRNMDTRDRTFFILAILPSEFAFHLIVASQICKF
jgi:hypothetical protein